MFTRKKEEISFTKRIMEIDYIIKDEDLRKYRSVPPRVAAKYIGKPVMFVRCGIQKEVLPIGTAIINHNRNYSYDIKPELLIAYQKKPQIQIKRVDIDMDKLNEQIQSAVQKAVNTYIEALA